MKKCSTAVGKLAGKPPRDIRAVIRSAAGLVLAIGLPGAITLQAAPDAAWPEITSQTRPWAYNWWMGSAVDRANLKRELARYHDAGLGGIHIIPIYGAKGWEAQYIGYLSPQWMDMLGFAVEEAHRLGLGVDMTTGTGWCFGGPNVSDQDANATLVTRTFDLAAGERLKERFNPKTTQALVAFGPGGKSIDLLPKIAAEGVVDFSAPAGPWRVYAVSQKSSGQKVKRAAPGGAGWMLNPLYGPAMGRYLEEFTDAFEHFSGPKPRAQYHDSYEYNSDWAPDLFAQFEKRRGYRLQDHLPAFLSETNDDYSARVKCDYSETVSDIMVEDSMPAWVKWSHAHGFSTRYQAHGSPGNLLDLYAVADISETEMFHTDRSMLISKFASSAAHVAGRPLVSAETGTWLAEHFTETLGELKFLVDDMFLSGINHIFYHGTCYSPDEAAWPGWVFYASTEMNPRNSIWRDVPCLNAYVARCQSILQSGSPDNDVLLYWPISDFWMEPEGRLPARLTVHSRSWLEGQAIGRAAQALWKQGYAFDYVSDRQLRDARASEGAILLAGGARYQTVVVPECVHMPLPTLRSLRALAEEGVAVVFETRLPQDVPGWNRLAERRAELKEMLGAMNRSNVFVGSLPDLLPKTKARREALSDDGLSCVRRRFEGGRHYFIANRGASEVRGWIKLADPAKSVLLMDPLTGDTGLAALRQANGAAEVYLQLAPGGSIILRAFDNREVQEPAWKYFETAEAGAEIRGEWEVKFLEGGPVLPAPGKLPKLESWTSMGDTNAQRFAGTALYSTRFDAPSAGGDAQLDLGKVCQSARVRVNGGEAGTLIAPPFRVVLSGLKPKDNLLEVEVTNVSANRIRDLDRRGVSWKRFNDINFVGLDYKPFDASNWPLTDSGLLGPVTITPLRTLSP